MIVIAFQGRISLNWAFGKHLLLPQILWGTASGIVERFGLSGAAVAQAIRRLRMASENDAKLREILNGVAKKSGFVGG